MLSGFLHGFGIGPTNLVKFAKCGGDQALPYLSGWLKPYTYAGHGRKREESKADQLSMKECR